VGSDYVNLAASLKRSDDSRCWAGGKTLKSLWRKKSTRQSETFDRWQKENLKSEVDEQARYGRDDGGTVRAVPRLTRRNRQSQMAKA